MATLISDPARRPTPAHPPPTPALWRELAPLATVLLAVTVLQRFAVPAVGSELGIGFVLGLLVFFWAAMQGRLLIDPIRFVLYLAAIAGILVSLAMGRGGYSLLSLAMLFLLYLPFIGVWPMQPGRYRELLGLLQWLACFVALSGILQFTSQFVLAADWMFPLDRLLPPALFIPGFNLVIEMSGGMIKSTGLWLHEPSHLSQLMALAILIELRHFARPLVLALLGLGLVSAFSGTGLLMLAVFAPLVLIQRRRSVALALSAILLVGLVMAFRDAFPVSFFIERLGEFTSTQTSGSMRFFGPYWATADIFAGRPDLGLFGTGPGSIAGEIGRFDYAVQDSSWLKLLVEYGLVGALPFAVFYGYCLFSGAPDRLIASALLFQVLFLGGFFLSFYVQFLVLALVSWPRLVPPDPAPVDPEYAEPKDADPTQIEPFEEKAPA